MMQKKQLPVPVSDKFVVDLVLRQIREKRPDSETISMLISVGVPAKKVPSVIESVRAGFSAGVTAVVTDGMSAQNICFGESPVFDRAFKKGKAAMRFTTPGWVLLRIVWPYILAAALLSAALFWWKMR